MLDRRWFLKYAGATAAVIGASALGLDYFVRNPQIPSQQTLTQSLTSSSLATTTISSSSLTQLVSLQGRLFFDYNGNGIQDTDEPSIQNARVQMQDSNARVIAEALTDSSGDYKLDIPAGNYKLFIQPDQSKSNNPNFGYMCTSPSEFRAITDGYDLSATGDGTFDVGLMEGFLTLPFNKNDSYTDIPDYVDLDPRPGYIRDWMGGKNTYDGHMGTDFVARKGAEILAAAPGQVFSAWNGWPNDPHWGINDYWKNGNYVVLSHGHNLWSAYHHLDSIAVPEVLFDTYPLTVSVKRGDVIGYCGFSGFGRDLTTTMTPQNTHLHFEMTDVNIDQSSKHFRDPFRDLYFGKYGYSRQSNPVSFWTVDNEMQYA